MERDAAATQPYAAAVGASVVDLSPDPQAWDEFVGSTDAGSYLQMTPWADVKAANHWLSLRFMGNGVPFGGPLEDGAPAGTFGAQLLLRRPPVFPWAFAYAPGGPACERWDRATLEAVTDGFRQAAASAPLKVSHVRIEPQIERNGPDDPDGELRSTLRGIGWRPAGGAQPSTARRIELAQDEDGLWRDVREEERREIERAGEAGVRVAEGDGDRLGDFHAVLRAANAAVGLPVRTEQSYRRIWNAFRPRGMARLLFAETPEGVPQATLLLLAGRARVWEAYGGMTAAAAGTGAGHLLRWEAILSSRRNGARSYEMPQLEEPGGTVSADFDAAFGGRAVRYVGAWELVLDSFGRFATESTIAARTLYGHFAIPPRRRGRTKRDLAR